MQNQDRPAQETKMNNPGESNAEAALREAGSAPDKPAKSSEPMLQFFQYAHLPAQLQQVSQPFCTLAEHLVATLPRNPERTTALRKLLEAKDCAVRALLYVDHPTIPGL
jgi:hypothetical protein